MAQRTRAEGVKIRKTRVHKVARRKAAGKPRLCVVRSNRHIYAQIIDDLSQRTLAEASTMSKEIKGKVKGGLTVAHAEAVGKLIAERAKGVSVESVCFDRGGFPFHGRIKALADAARAEGLKF